jgi:hypothetical protein
MDHVFIIETESGQTPALGDVIEVKMSRRTTPFHLAAALDGLAWSFLFASTRSLVQHLENKIRNTESLRWSHIGRS